MNCSFFHFAIVAVVSLELMGGTGCGTPAPTANPGRLSAKTNGAPPPFLGKDDYTERLGMAMQNVLAGHRFTLPPIVVQGSDGSIWFVTERLESRDRFDRIYVHVTADSDVEANIRPYDYILDDWADRKSTRLNSSHL